MSKKDKIEVEMTSDDKVIFKAITFNQTTEDRLRDIKSKQLPPSLFEQSNIRDVIIRPLYDPMLWSQLLEISTRLKRSVELMALNTVGLGWEIVPLEESEDFKDQNARLIQEEREVLTSIFKFPNPDMPFSELVSRIKVDEETTGQGYLEIIRNLKRDIIGFAHVPSHTVRVLRNGRGFLQMRGSDTRNAKKVFFKHFGDILPMNVDKGDKLKISGVSLRGQANEMIQFRLYTPRSSFYGIPRAVSASAAISGNRLAQIRNVSFFANDAPQSLRSKILTPNGWSTMGDMKIGSEVIGSDGKGHKVIEVIPQGIKDVYKVTFSDGYSTECTLGHIWNVSNSYDRQRGISRTMTLKEIIDKGFRYECGTAKWSIPMPDPVEYTKAKEKLPLDPYFLGYLLGNGSFREKTTLSCWIPDANELQSLITPVLPDGIEITRRDRTEHHGSEFNFIMSKNKRVKYNKLTSIIKELGLYNLLGKDKFIPEQYLRASIKDREAILQGLIDSDGCVADTSVRYVSKSHKLAVGVAELVGSLGGVASIRETTGRDLRQVTVCRLPENIIPARLRRKSRYYHMNSSRIRSMVSAELIGQVETQCIRIDVEDSLYITDNFILTHNTPRMAIIVTGGELGDGVVDSIKEFFENRGKGVENAARTMILQADVSGSMLDSQKRPDIKIQPLTVGTIEDASFTRYTFSNDEEVRETFGIGKIFYGTADDVNRACYDEETETLTYKGWKKYWEIEENDLIATFNPKTEKIEYHKPTEKHLYDVDEKLNYIKNSCVDIAVTNDHDMWVKTPTNQGHTPFSKMKIQNIKPKRFLFADGVAPTGSPEERAIFTLPKVEKMIWENVGTTDLALNFNHFIEFLGYFISEGGLAVKDMKLNNSYHLTLGQNEGLIADRMDFILNELGFNYDKKTDKYGCVKFNVYGKQLCTWLLENCGDYCKNKRVPREFMQMSVKQSKILFQALMDGDGHKGEKGEYYSSTSLQLANDVQELAIKLGFRSKVSVSYEANGNKSTCYRVTICRRRKGGYTVTSDQITKKHYKGKVYCFEVPNHLFVTRRNGCVTIQGNTAHTMKTVTVEQIFAPEAKRYEYVISNKIMREMGAEVTKFVFKKPKTTDQQEEANTHMRQSAAGGITPNDIRDSLNKPRFEGDWAKTPLPILEMGYLEGKGTQVSPLAGVQGQEQEVAKSYLKNFNFEKRKATIGMEELKEDLAEFVDKTQKSMQEFSKSVDEVKDYLRTLTNTDIGEADIKLVNNKK